MRGILRGWRIFVHKPFTLLIYQDPEHLDIGRTVSVGITRSIDVMPKSYWKLRIFESIAPMDMGHMPERGT